MVAASQAAAGETRLAIPILYGVDAVTATTTSRAPDLPAQHRARRDRRRGARREDRPGDGDRDRGDGIRWDYARVVAVPRTYAGDGLTRATASRRRSSESLAAAFIRGLQAPTYRPSRRSRRRRSASWATVARPGHVGRPNYRIDHGVTAGDAALIRSVHLPPYQAAIDAGARIVMASFSGTEAGGKIHGDQHWPLRSLRTSSDSTASSCPTGRPSTRSTRTRGGRSAIDRRRDRHGDGPV